jgi:hypothetical protein
VVGKNVLYNKRSNGTPESLNPQPASVLRSTPLRVAPIDNTNIDWIRNFDPDDLDVSLHQDSGDDEGRCSGMVLRCKGRDASHSGNSA